ncbi:MAG TPA: hypothetical protein PKC69_15050, partial [Chitinophagaceae bacterium]|nr:hypothetical protein [Chitinophagaceae bacterium]
IIPVSVTALSCLAYIFLGCLMIGHLISILRDGKGKAVRYKYQIFEKILPAAVLPLQIAAGWLSANVLTENKGFFSQNW